MHTSARSAYTGVRFGRGRYGRGRARSPPPANRPTCQVCNKAGHIALNCWYRYDEFYTPQESAPRTEPATQTPATKNVARQQASTSDSGDVAPQALVAYNFFDPSVVEIFTIPLIQVQLRLSPFLQM